MLEQFWPDGTKKSTDNDFNVRAKGSGTVERPAPPTIVRPTRAQMESPLTPDRVREVIDYDPETGVMRWKIARSSSNVVGGLCQSQGEALSRSSITIDGKTRSSQILAWMHYYGVYPRCHLRQHNDSFWAVPIANLYLAYAEKTPTAPKEKSVLAEESARAQANWATLKPYRERKDQSD